MDEEIRNRLQAALDRLPPRENPPPFDPARAVVLLRNEGKTGVEHKPGAFLTDAGEPVGIEPAQRNPVTIGTVNLTADQWEQVARYLLKKTR